VKILFIAPRMHSNQWDLITHLAMLGHELRYHVALLDTYDGCPSVQRDILEACKLSLIIDKKTGSKNDRPFLFPSPVRCVSEIRSFSPDAVVIRNPLRIHSVIAALYSYLARIPCIVYTQTDISKLTITKKVIIYFITLIGIKWYSVVDTLGHFHGKPIGRLGINYIPFAVYPVYKQRSPQCIVKYSPPRILMVGKFGSLRKNHEVFIDALSIVKRTHASFVATIVGSCRSPFDFNRLEYLREKISSEKLEDYLDLRYNLSHEKMRDLYSISEIFVLPSIAEPASVSLVEAMSAGLAVICCYDSGTRGYLQDGISGFIAQSVQPREYAKLIIRLLSDRSLLQRMSMAARLQAAHTTHPSLVSAKFIDLLEVN